jgi:hypothetical protein
VTLPCFQNMLGRSRQIAKPPQFAGVDIFDRDNIQSDQADSDEEVEEENGEDNEEVHEEVHEELTEELNTVDDSGIDKLRWNLNEPLYEARLEREQFNLINSRFLADGINEDRWCSLVRDCWWLLVPGGWLQMVEPVWAFQSYLGQDLPCLEAWWNHYAEALRLMQKNARVGRDLLQHMRNAEFQSIWSEARNVPASGWKDRMPGSAHIFLVVGVRR